MRMIMLDDLNFANYSSILWRTNLTWLIAWAGLMRLYSSWTAKWIGTIWCIGHETIRMSHWNAQWEPRRLPFGLEYGQKVSLVLTFLKKTWMEITTWQCSMIISTHLIVIFPTTKRSSSCTMVLHLIMHWKLGSGSIKIFQGAGLVVGAP